MEEAKYFMRKGYRTRTRLELVGNQDKECFLCGKKHRVSYPLDPNMVYWNEKLDNYSFIKSPLIAYTRGMHTFDLARSQVVPACTCNCKSCKVAKCLKKQERFWNVDLTQGSAQCCRTDGWVDGRNKLQGVLRINTGLNEGILFTYFIEVEGIEGIEGMMMDYYSNHANDIGE